MSILIDEQTRVLVQGITGRDGSFHTASMLEYGTKVVGGVTPGKGGQSVSGVPVFNTVKEAVNKTGATCSIIFVPPKFATGALREAADAGIKNLVCITEGVPIMQMVENYQYLKTKGVRLIGPNCPGLISPGKSKVGIMPGFIYGEGSVGIISRSGTLTHEIASNLTYRGIGQSTCVCIGGDMVKGTDFVDVLKLFREDPETEKVILIGEIGGAGEELAARYLQEHPYPKKVVAFIAGATAPPEKRMGHAGAIISAGFGTADSKIRSLREAGVTVVESLDEMIRLCR
jgi:succinyl-CoA synthetase alpha subunit